MKIYCGEIWTTNGEPPLTGRDAESPVAIPAGALAVGSDGFIHDVGSRDHVCRRHPKAAVEDFGDAIILPGFVDAHTHFPQIDIIGSYGEELLGWLQQYTYPAEARISTSEQANSVAARFLSEMIRNGTTMAAIYSNSHLDATHALLASIADLGFRAIVGKTSMDRDAPPSLCVDVEQDATQWQELISLWGSEKNPLIDLAITPRFAPACSPALLQQLGNLTERHPELYIQTHHAENRDEVALVRSQFPAAAHYVDVYRRHNLLSPKTILGHSIYIDDDELEAIAAAGSLVAHCPTSNLFLGSGLFPLKRFSAYNIPVLIGTDIGAGTSFSMWRTLGEAYKIQQLQHLPISPAWLFYAATAGAGKALGKPCGTIEVGMMADLQILDWRRNPALAARFNETSDAFDRLFALFFYADDRLTKRVTIAGRDVYMN